jgi:hypothetical protein
VSKIWIEKVVTKSEIFSQLLKLCWLQKGNLVQEDQQLLMNFFFENEYRNVVWCVENSRNTCHIVLEKPWQHDGEVIHNGFRNTNSFDENPKNSEVKIAELDWPNRDFVRKELEQKDKMVCVIIVLLKDVPFLTCVRSIAVLYRFSFSCVVDMSIQYRMNCSYLDNFSKSVNCMSRTKFARFEWQIGK